MKVIAGNLPDNIRAEEIQHFFEAAGKVSDIRMLNNIYTGKFRGMAYVTMSSNAEAKAAVQLLNGKKLKDHSVSVEAVILKKL